VYEVVDGTLGSGETDVEGGRQQFGGVRARELNEQIALEATRLQDKLMADGDRMATRDLLIAATARSTGDELLVADRDFETDRLIELIRLRASGPTVEIHTPTGAPRLVSTPNGW